MTLGAIAIASLIAAAICAVIVVLDLVRTGGQHMRVMNVVWPLTAIYAGPLGLWAYWRVGRLSSHRRMEADKAAGREPAAKQKPFWQMTAVAATHCGAGCTLGDAVVEGSLAAVPLTLFGSTLAATWTLDFIAAFCFGIAFQYFTIAPMRGLGVRDGITAALKADTLSLTAWQVGMYGCMAILSFGVAGHELPKQSALFWAAMQVAMLAGFVTAYPVNWWLLVRGLKERM